MDVLGMAGWVFGCGWMGFWVVVGGACWVVGGGGWGVGGEGWAVDGGGGVVGVGWWCTL